MLMSTCIHVWAWTPLCVHKYTDYVHTHTRVGMIALMCTNVQAWAWLHLCAHAYTCAHDYAYGYIKQVCDARGRSIERKLWSSKQVRDARECAHICTCGHDHTYVHIHPRVGMIAPMCAYTRGHGRACVCMHVWAWSCLCACTHGHDRAYVCMQAWSWSRLCLGIYAWAWSRLCVHTFVGKILLKCRWLIEFMCKHSWRCDFCSCAHTHVCMIVLMCKYTYRKHNFCVHSM